MALTDYEKRKLDSAILEKMETNIGREFETADFRQLCQEIGIPYNPNSINSSLARLQGNSRRYYTIHVRVVTMDRKTKRYWSLIPAAHILSDDEGFKKERNILYFNCNKDLFYDFNTKKLSFELNSDCHSRNHFNFVLAYRIEIMEMLQYEWLFNYCNSFRTITEIYRGCAKEMYQTMPKDYIKNFGNEINRDLIVQAYFQTKYDKYGKAVQGLYENLTRAHFRDVEKMFNQNGGFHAYVSLVKNSVLNGDMSDYINTCAHMCELYLEVTEDKNVPFTLDLNRDFRHNIESLKAIIDKEKNDKLAQKMQQLNFINNMVFNDYIVVVPQNVQEKADEGKQQNNCVGYYYDDHILEDYDLIYFLRKINAPKKSYITCRYNIDEEATVEFRYKNNNPVNNANEISILRSIDKIIKANL